MMVNKRQQQSLEVLEKIGDICAGKTLDVLLAALALSIDRIFRQVPESEGRQQLIHAFLERLKTMLLER